jgi:hypothetical protein
MPTLPALDLKTNINHSPHVVILGAGASRAACPKGDAGGKYVPVLRELNTCLDLEPLFRKNAISYENTDFESMYDDLVTSGKHAEVVKELEHRVQDYFSQLKLPKTATIYDYLVLSLREQDLIVSFNWDPFLTQAWERNSKAVKLPTIVFLHGNVDISVCRKDRVKDFRGNICSKCKEPLVPAPLLYPVRQKNYNAHAYIEAEWNELRGYLERAYLLTIFGYAAPKTDVEARALLLETWKKNPMFELAQVEIIDVKPRKELVSTWEEFFCRSHYGISETIWKSYLFYHPRRSSEALAMATLQNMPWKDNPFPRTTDLKKLQEWARLLWLEETTGRLSGLPKDFV